VSVLIVAGAPVSDPGTYAPLLKSAGFVIAADAGADLCMALGRAPDLFVGDADSVAPSTLELLAEGGVESHIAPSDKSVSDLDLALGAARERGGLAPVITAAWGGRADHAIAVIGSLFDAWDLQPEIVEPGSFRGWVLAPGGREELSVGGDGRILSLLAGPRGATVSVSGTRWPLSHEHLEPLSRRGLSNLVIGEAAHIAIHEGSVLVLS